MNRLRHLALRTQPAPVGHADFDVHGPDGSPWVLAYANACASLDIPFGWLLIGKSFYWQALVGAPLRFTNRERVTVHGN